ncbi:hypothetical protein [Actinokineospora sp. UTMC 2448]|nr:hypothetical protein [Actinokineospora sp. UTMC 2448]UVS78417.1 hypothetical protein Actkin_02150 [Actinokineospora sp. UTMC 2448]
MDRKRTGKIRRLVLVAVLAAAVLVGMGHACRFTSSVMQSWPDRLRRQSP